MEDHTSLEANSDSDDQPVMDANLDDNDDPAINVPLDDGTRSYVDQLTATIADTQQNRAANLRTTDYTVTQFEQTKRDRQWKMRQDGVMVDSVLVCADDNSEQSVHLDLLLSLDPDMIPFFHEMNTTNDQGNRSAFILDSSSPTTITTHSGSLPRFLVDSGITVALLNELIYFAYHGRCAELTEQNALLLGGLGVKYKIPSLVEHCLAYLMTAPYPAIDRLLHALERQSAAAEVKAFVQKYRHSKPAHLLIAAGGWDELGPTNSIEIYDYHTKLWRASQLKLPLKVSFFSFEVIDSKLYIFGGLIFGSFDRVAINTLHSLDLSKTDPKWTVKCSMLVPRSHLSSAVVNGRIFAIGGTNGEVGIGRKCEIYDPASDTWTQIADLNHGRSFASATVFNGRVYVAGGYVDTNDAASVEVYYPQSNHWQLVQHMTSPRIGLSLIAYQKRIWAIGGKDDTNYNLLRSVESYHPETNTWQAEAPLGDARSHFGATNFNGLLIAVGGFNNAEPTWNSSSVQQYDEEMSVWRLVCPLMQVRCALCLVSVPNQFQDGSIGWSL